MVPPNLPLRLNAPPPSWDRDVDVVVLGSGAAGLSAALAARPVLAPDARIYVEHRVREPLPALPDGWRSVRDGRAGEVGYHLLAT